MIIQPLLKIWLFIASAAFLFISCTTAENETVSENPFEGVPEIDVSDPLDITDQASSGSSSFYFPSNFFHDMVIDNRGNYFVYNRGSEPIYHFDENGEFISSIGRRGQGPGEFQTWPSFDTASSDTLYTLDSLARVANRFVFKNGEWVHDVAFRVQNRESHSPDKILQIDHEHLIVEYSPNVRGSMNESDNSFQASKKYDLIKTTGELIREDWLTTPAHERSIYRSSTGSGATHMLPFGSRSIANVGPNGHLYHLWSSEFVIDVYDLEGSAIKKLQQSSFNYSLSDEIRQNRVDDVVSIRMGTEREQQELMKQTFDDTPQNAPELRDFHVDRDTGHIIVRRYIFEDQGNWMLLDDEGNRVGVFTLDENLTVFDFRNGTIIGSLNIDDELPTVRIHTLPQSAL